MAQGAAADSSGTSPNGPEAYHFPETVPAKGSKTVLTLFGGDRQAKQLFSSLGKRKSPGADDLSEQALPNGISTTEIIPTHSLDDAEDKKGPTFREKFPPAPTLAPLLAPRPSKHTTSRSGPVTWHTPSVASRKIVDRRSYATQALPTGNWLTYNVPPAPKQHSPETKRKQRDRALSFGEAQSPTNDESTAAHNQAKDDALFRSVYSSFAPDRDDSFAVVATQEKNRMWYGRYGQDLYQDLLDIKNQILYGDILEDEDQEEPINEGEIREALETWVPPESTMGDPLFANGTKQPSEKEANETLAEISDLLETLSSHQRIRYEALPLTTRSSTGSIPTIAGTPAHPASPSSAEFEVYEALKARLTSIVSELPPYMLSKLDGDKLGALNISTRIQLEGKNQKGTLQEDELSTKTRAAARAPVPPAATQTPGAYSGTRGASGYQAQVHTSSSHFTRPPYGAPTSATRPGMPQTYSSSHYAGRPPPAGYPSGSARPPYTPQGSYGSQRPPSYTERFTNGTTQYGTPQNFNSYGNAGFRSQGQQASSYNSQYTTPQARVPGSAATHLQAYRATQSTQSEYQQRVSAPGQGYSYGNTPVGAGTSPQPSPQHRPSFSAHGQSPNPPRPQLYQQASSNHGSHSPQPQTNGAGANATGRISPDDQAALMNRQKAQLAEAAQQIRQASGTPQPAVPNGGSRNGTPGQ